MNCQGCDNQLTGRQLKFCSDKCRVTRWMAAHPRKGKHPKRIRSRERDRLYTIIHRGETIDQLREQAREAARVQAMRNEVENG